MSLNGSIRATSTPTIPDSLLATVKGQLRYTATNQDKEIYGLIRDALSIAERYTGRAVFNTTYVYTFRDFPSVSQIKLPRVPIQSVTSITYTDTAGASQTWAASNYSVTTNSLDEAIIELDDDSDYPDVKEDIPEGVTITYVAGYGTKESDLPQWLRRGVVMIAAHLFNVRDGQNLEGLNMIKQSFLQPYRVYNV